MMRNVLFQAGGLMVVGALFGLGIANAQSVPAQAPSNPPAGDLSSMQALYDAAFQETLRKPADPAILVSFAEIAISIGDLEGAISALDRLLLIDGDQPDVKLELGVLYFRLGSFEAARSYLEEVGASNRASSTAKERAAAYIKEIRRP